MHGKALFFKTIAVQQDEIRSNFQRVPDDMTLAQAVEQLEKQSTEKSIAVRTRPFPLSNETAWKTNPK
jgi:hypothetical protein